MVLTQFAQTSEWTWLATFYLIAFLFLLPLIILYIIPQIITLWILFTKAGKPGWASIVPVYSYVVMAQIARIPAWIGWTTGVLIVASGLLSFLTIVWLGFAIYMYVYFVQSMRAKPVFWVLFFVFPIASVFMTKGVSYAFAGAPVATGSPYPQPVAGNVAQMSAQAPIPMQQPAAPAPMQQPAAPAPMQQPAAFVPPPMPTQPVPEQPVVPQQVSAPAPVVDTPPAPNSIPPAPVA